MTERKTKDSKKGKATAQSAARKKRALPALGVKAPGPKGGTRFDPYKNYHFHV